MYIWTMRRACEIEAVSSCVDDANFVSHNDYCSNNLCNNEVSPSFN